MEASRWKLWLQRLIMGWAIFMLGFWVIVGASLWWLHGNLDRVLKLLIQSQGLAAEVGQASAQERTLQIQGLKLGDFAEVDWLEVRFDPLRIWLGEIKRIHVRGIRLWMGRMQEAVARYRAMTGVETAGAPGKPFLFKRVVIDYGKILLDHLGGGIPPIPIEVGMTDSLVLENLLVGGPDDDPAAFEVMDFTAHDVVIYSPYDYSESARVLEFREILLSFSWAGIQAGQLDRVWLREPKIYAGDDLFWFVDQLKNLEGEASLWNIGHFKVEGGRLLLSVLGSESLQLPLTFQAEEHGLVVGDLSRMHLQTKFEIPRTTQVFPDQQVVVRDMEGVLFFALPPGAQATNLVPTVTIAALQWRNLAITDVSAWITLDRTGFYGQFTGKAYGGFAEGGFFMKLESGLPWTAWTSVTQVDMRPITELLTPQHLIMEGPVNAVAEVKGQSVQILSSHLDLQLAGPGRLHLPAVQDVIDYLPADWPALKKDLARIALEGFADYSSTGGNLMAHYDHESSFLTLRLQGLQGERNVNIHWDGLSSLLTQVPWQTLFP